MRRVTDTTRKLVRLPAGRRANSDATAHIERNGSNRTHRHHIQQHLVLIVLIISIVFRTLGPSSPRRIIVGQSEPASMLPPTRRGVKVRRVDERKTAEVFRWCPGEEGVPCARWGEVEGSCELRGVACSGEESQ